MMKTRFSWATAFATVLATCFAFTSITSAQNGEFDDLYLDGGSGFNPFIRFDQADGLHHYMVGFSDRLDFYVENGYKFEITNDAANDSIVVDDQGVTTVELNVETDVDQAIEIIVPETDQSFGLTALSSNETSAFNGGVGIFTDTSSYPFWVYNGTQSETLALSPGGIGMGLYEAESALHVYADGSPFNNARVLIENNLSNAFREMLAMVNNGGSRFTMENTATSDKWAFSNDSLGRFTFSYDGTGGPELAVWKDGRVTMGPGNQNRFDLRPNGNLIITGTLTQSSDKNLKRAFQDVDAENVLEKIAAMPVTTWQFKDDEESVRHMGPTAQDFRKAFGLGINDRTIAPVDGIGVSLAGIKALDSKVDQLAKSQAHVAELEKQVEDQQELIENLVARLEQLEAMSTLK